MDRTTRRIAALIAIAAALGNPLWAQPQPPARVEIKDLAARPAEYLRKEIVAIGVLVNQGKNYFTDLRIILKDDQGRFIHVRPWLPTSLPPRPPQGPTTGTAAPAVLSDFLGKKVELTGRLMKGQLRRVGDVYYLEVRTARIRP